MKKLSYLLILFLALTLGACSQEPEPEDLGLYRAYKMVDNREQWGFIDERGKFKIKPKYSQVGDFDSGLALVESDGLFGLINTEGLEILKPEFSKISPINEGYFVAYRDKGARIFNSQGPINLDKDYSNIGRYSDGCFTVVDYSEEEGSKFGYIDSQGRELIAPRYSQAFDFYKSRAIVKEDGKYKLIDKQARVKKELDVKSIRQSNEPGLYIFSRNMYDYGLMDQEGRVLVPAKYSSIVEVREDLLVVGETIKGVEQFGVLERTGKRIVASNYDDIRLLGQGYIGISKEIGLMNKPIYELIDRRGERLTKDKYYNVGGYEASVGRGEISVSTGLTSYLIDLEGRRLTSAPSEPGYGEIRRMGRVFRSLVEDELVYYNMEGEIIWEADRRFLIDESRELVEKKIAGEGWLHISYPHLIGFSNREVQNTINSRLKEEFSSWSGEKNLREDFTYYKTSYQVQLRGQILTIERNLNCLVKGSDQEIFSKAIYNIDLETGDFYRLEDLMEGDHYPDLNQLLASRLGLEDSGFRPLNENTYFKIQEDNIYFILEYRNKEGLVTGYKEVDFSLEEVAGILDLSREFFTKI